MNVGINTFVPISLLTALCIVTAVYGIKCTNRTFVSTKPSEVKNGAECSSSGCVVAYCTFGPSARVLYQTCVTDRENCAQMAKKCEVMQQALGTGKLGGCKECREADYCNVEALISQPKAINNGTVPNPAPVNNNGTAPNPDVVNNNGTAPNPDVVNNNGTAPNPAPVNNNGTAPNPAKQTIQTSTEKPIKISTASLNNTEKPINMTTASLKNTENPIEMTTESLKDTEKPIEMTTAPDTVKPTKMSTASVAVTKMNMPTTHQYVQVTNKNATKSATTDKYLWGIEFGV
uniref:Uncharacterized protein n=1 Tax=Globodera rostochiensis TaxID=31243 RepID=A0A914ICS9_GLORO